jgi:hypothetical protein
MDVLPFLPVAFVAAQNVVETTLLPHLRTLSSQTSATRKRLFQLPNPATKNETCVAAREQMHVLRHYNVSANSDVEFPLSVCSKIYERLMHIVARQPFSATVSAKGDEVERPRVKEPVQTEWPPHKVSLHAKSCIAKPFCSSSKKNGPQGRGYNAFCSSSRFSL